MCPRFWGLGTGPETAHLSIVLLLGELIGISVEHILRQSFESSYVAQQQLFRRLEQLDGEKERLDYELRMEQRRATATTAGVHANAAPGSTSSYGTDAELTELDLLAEGSSRAVVKPSALPPSALPPSALPPSALDQDDGAKQVRRRVGSALPPSALPPSALPPYSALNSAFDQAEGVRQLKRRVRALRALHHDVGQQPSTSRDQELMRFTVSPMS